MDSSELGKRGEEEAARYLESRGWTILDRNFRVGRNEVDIVAAKGRVLAFVEVKCRRGRGFGHPLEAITPKKRAEIARVARGWIRQRELPSGTVARFDAVAVLWMEGGRAEVVHVPDAWRMG
jgi:putative endonuclease